MTGFGASGPIEALYPHFGITAEAVAEKVEFAGSDGGAPMAWKTLDDMDLTGKVVLTRVDINVPVEDGRVTDATRIERIVPTIRDILKAGGKPVLMAHFGRPKGKVVPEMSLKVVLPALEAALGQHGRLRRRLRRADGRGRGRRRCRRAACCCWRTPASTRARRRTIRRSRRRWRSSATSIATTPSRRRTGRMPRPRRWRGCCRPAPGG